MLVNLLRVSVSLLRLLVSSLRVSKSSLRVLVSPKSEHNKSIFAAFEKIGSQPEQILLNTLKNDKPLKEN